MNETAHLTISPWPHITKKNSSTRRTMLHVLIALLPATFAATYYFGHMVLINVFFCVLFCMGGELLYNMLIKKSWSKEGLKNNSAWDFSPAVTGVILALNLPTCLNIWGFNITGSDGTIYFSFDTVIACLIGSLVAIILVKMLFGGIGKNFANPAAVGRIFLLIAFASAFTNIASNAGLNAITHPTWLGEKETAVPLLDMFLGRTGATAVGETCTLAILAGYIYLSAVRVIDFRIPLIIVVSTVLLTVFFDGHLKYIINNAMANAAKLSSPLHSIKEYAMFAARHALSGGLIFGAVFMATDYSSTPNTFWGRVVFAVGVGLFTAVIRTWAMPEGISFAIVIMNVATPLINKAVRPKFFGEKQQKKEAKAKKRADAKTAQTAQTAIVENNILTQNNPQNSVPPQNSTQKITQNSTSGQDVFAKNTHKTSAKKKSAGEDKSGGDK